MQNVEFLYYLCSPRTCVRGRAIFMEQFFRTHDYLVEHLEASVRRDLMDEIDWSSRMIGIKGTRGVGKTTFLLQYAKEKFGRDRSCLYINMNNFYFQGHGIAEFAGNLAPQWPQMKRARE